MGEIKKETLETLAKSLGVTPKFLERGLPQGMTDIADFLAQASEYELRVLRICIDSIIKSRDLKVRERPK